MRPPTRSISQDRTSLLASPNRAVPLARCGSPAFGALVRLGAGGALQQGGGCRPSVRTLER
eukprot:7421976-Pyramimonas_sp.AAC.1